MDRLLDMRIHFVGIGGSGMCGIAEILVRKGYDISGSDITQSAAIKILESLGVTIHIGHLACQVREADVVVYSSAIDQNNVEIEEALSMGIPLIPRALMLAELMRFKYGIAVAGSHGKTTTTSMIASILSHLELAPTFVIGGVVKSHDSNAALGSGKYMVAESDESDTSFLYLNPVSVVITNIEPEHLIAYGNDFSQLKQAFCDFIQRTPFYGVIVLCYDDPVQRSFILSKSIQRRTITYGFDPESDIIITARTQEQQYNTFNIRYLNQEHTVCISLPGKHNCLNAVASIALALSENLPIKGIIEAIEKFHGVDRRFDILLQNDIMLIDDYGHHPQEIKATLEAIRSGWGKRRVVMIFQPHRPSRTKDHYDEFVQVLSQVDKLIVLDIYNAGEQDIEGITSAALVQSIEKHVPVRPIHIQSISQVLEYIRTIYKPGDIIITQGAGDIAQLAQELKLELA